ncbi:TPA: glycosyltransferase family 1 protein [Candidatus Sumerlaeota bacterium]|nr:glycosyltransferase family 1 protein [Candidatus Sumerlaeota bacterium]
MPLKVLQLCAVDFSLAKFLAPLCFKLQDAGYDVTAACTETVFMAPLRAKGLRCVNLPISRSMNIKDHWHSYLALSKWLKEEHFDIVHVHTPIASLIGRFAAARRGVPVRIYTAHGFYFHDQMPPLKRNFHVGLERIGGCFSHYLFTQSEEDRQTAIEKKIARADHVRTIGNGIDLTRFNPARLSASDRAAMRESLGIPADAPTLCIIGRLVREKGYFELFRAVKKLIEQFPHFRLIVIGDALPSDHDDSTAELLALVESLGIQQHIVFTGQRTDVPEVLSAADVFTLPSWREGMPRSVIEAMSMSLPCVVTDIRGCREEIVHGECGWIIPVRDEEALASRCANLLGNPDKARAMGQAARARAERFYSEEVVMKNQLEVYEILLKNKGLI